MMSSSVTRVTRRNARSFVPQAVAVDDRVAEIQILDDTPELTVLMAGARYSLSVRPICHATPACTSLIRNRTPWLRSVSMAPICGRVEGRQPASVWS
jgi:hypothetical protein